MFFQSFRQNCQYGLDPHSVNARWRPAVSTATSVRLAPRWTTASAICGLVSRSPGDENQRQINTGTASDRPRPRPRPRSTSRRSALERPHGTERRSIGADDIRRRGVT